MHLSNARESYYYNSGKAGDVGRQLALAGIAAVWLLHGGPASLVFPKDLLIAMGCFLLSLIFDFFQYLGSAVIWGVYSRHKEKQFQKNHADPAVAEFLAPIVTNWWGILWFLGKSASLIVGGVYLGCYIIAKVAAA